MMRILFFIILLMGVYLSFAGDFERQKIKERIQPLGSVTVAEEGQPVDAEKQVNQQQKSKETNEEALSGKEIYQQYCRVCHQNGLAGAPKYKDKKDWQARMADQTIEGLTASAVKGMNAMPPKGTCLKCSNADIRAAIEYMVP